MNDNNLINSAGIPPSSAALFGSQFAMPIVQPPNIPFNSNAISNMPVPAEQPWSADAMPWTNPAGPMSSAAASSDVVAQFNGLCMVPTAATTIRPTAIQHHKRKAFDHADASILFNQPTPKRLITDEQMVQHMNGMHISSQFTAHQQSDDGSQFGGVGGGADNNNTSASPFTELTSPTSATSPNGRASSSGYNANRDLQRKLRNAQRITICDEIRRIQHDPLLPDSLMLQRIERPCTALVLWQPSARPLSGGGGGATDVINSSSSSSSSDEDSSSDAIDSRRNRMDLQNNSSNVSMLASTNTEMNSGNVDADNNNSNSSMEMDL